MATASTLASGIVTQDTAGALGVGNDDGGGDAGNPSGAIGSTASSEWVVDPALVNEGRVGISSADGGGGGQSSVGANTSNDEAAVHAEDNKQLKASWLTLLPIEQVIGIVFKLEEHVSEDVRVGIWPKDLKKAVEELKGRRPSQGAEEPMGDAATSGGNVDGGAIATANVREISVASATATPTQPQVVEVNSPPPNLPLSQPSPFTHPLLPTPRHQATPPPMTLPSPPPPPAAVHYPYYGYPGYGYAPMQNPNQQPYGAFSSYPPPQMNLPSASLHGHGKQSPAPLFTSAPLRGASEPSKPPIAAPPPPSQLPQPSLPLSSHSIPPHPIPPHPLPPKNDDDDLPSYEDMIVQALIEINDPSGVQPRTLFSWMASRYPLQSNFRPSASQALQKAFKRGRFEKSEEGRYRLNAAWEGGSTSKRTTRRPQTFAQSATNPHPSSHPPAPFPYPPWSYGQAPPQSIADTQPQHATSAQAQPAQPDSQQPPTASQEQSTANAPPSPQTDHANEAWEAAQSILQALNIGSLLQQASASTAVGASASTGEGVTGTGGRGETQQQQSSTATTAAPSYPPPIIAGDILFGSSTAAASTSALASTSAIFPTTAGPTSSSNVQPQISQAQPFPALSQPTVHTQSLQIQHPTQANVNASRAALQGSLALLAAQLADIAGAGAGVGSMDSTRGPVDPIV